MGKTLPPATVVSVFNRALAGADAELWERIKTRPEERKALLACVDALEVVRDQVLVQLDEVMRGDTKATD